jgi:[ribosomal protein S18]-alanine N-acetyltransferase
MTKSGVAKENKSIRWAIRRDIDSIARLELYDGQSMWNRDDILEALRQHHVIGNVFEKEGEVVAFVAYELSENCYDILTLVTDPSHRKMGIATKLIERMEEKIAHLGKRKFIEIKLRDINLHAQNFLKKLGFSAVEVFPKYYEDYSQDCYLFRKEIIKEA